MEDNPQQDAVILRKDKKGKPLGENMEKRRCRHCRKMMPVCDLNSHPIYGLICKSCYDKFINK